MGAAKIKKGDEVVVLSGKDKGLTGTVLVVYGDRDKVLSARRILVNHFRDDPAHQAVHTLAAHAEG